MVPSSHVQVFSHDGLSTGGPIASPSWTKQCYFSKGCQYTITHPTVTSSKAKAYNPTLLALLDEVKDPKTTHQALTQPQWVAAVTKELDALHQNKT